MKDVWTSDWKRVRSALLRVRQAVDVHRAGDLDRESFALRGVAAHETFATLETDVDAERRGRLIVTYVAGLVRKSFSEYPDHDQRGADVLRDWLRIVTEGVTARALAAQTTGRVADPQEVHRAEQRIEDRLWLGGNRQSSASRAAIHALYTTVTGGMHARLDAGGQAALVGESVTWEWDGLTQRHDHAARALLSVLALRAQYVVASRPPCRSLADTRSASRSCDPSALTTCQWAGRAGSGCSGASTQMYAAAIRRRTVSSACSRRRTAWAFCCAVRFNSSARPSMDTQTRKSRTDSASSS